MGSTVKPPEIIRKQEYSSRQAGVTTGIILACLVPILLIVVCVGYRILKGRKEQREQDEVLARTRQAELQRMRKIGEEEEPVPYTSSSRATEIN
ncbi:hypothetical protein DMN91_004663 [Ooceraea biroi]|nr:hypothetical protein DMN91_004663 [Ooceraea biroi]